MRVRRICIGMAFVLLLGWLVLVNRLAAPPAYPEVDTRTVTTAAGRLVSVLTGAAPRIVAWQGAARTVFLRWGDERLVARGSGLAAAFAGLERLLAARVRAVSNLAAVLSNRPFLLSVAGPDKAIPFASTFLWNFTLIHGVDGLVARDAAGERYLLPEETLHTRFSGGEVFSFLPVRFGINRRTALGALAAMAPLAPGAAAAVPLPASARPPGTLTVRRFRTRSFACRPDGREVVPMFRLAAPVPETPTRALVTASGVRAGDWFIRHLDTKRKIFSYRYDPWTGQSAAWDYSLPRHAGSVLILYRIHGLTKEVRFLEAGDTALGYLLARLGAAPRGAFVGGEGVQVKLGTTALTALALFARRTATGATNHDAVLGRLLEFMEWMVPPSGRIASYYNPTTRRRDEKSVAQNFPGQAIWALAKGVRVFGRDPAPFIRAMDHQADRAWNFPFAGYYIFPFSWEMQAVAEIAPRLRQKNWERFLYEAADSMLDFQYTSDWPFPDYRGGFGTPEFFVPLAHAAGFQGEGTSAAYGYARRRGDAARAARYRNSLLLMTRFLLSQQVTPENALFYRDPELAAGAFRAGPADHRQQIDYTQHVYAALLNSLEEEVYP